LKIFIGEQTKREVGFDFKRSISFLRHR